eukprot:g5776.t1
MLQQVQKRLRGSLPGAIHRQVGQLAAQRQAAAARAEYFSHHLSHTDLLAFLFVPESARASSVSKAFYKAFRGLSMWRHCDFLSVPDYLQMRFALQLGTMRAWPERLRVRIGQRERQIVAWLLASCDCRRLAEVDVGYCGEQVMNQIVRPGATVRGWESGTMDLTSGAELPSSDE